MTYCSYVTNYPVNNKRPTCTWKCSTYKWGQYSTIVLYHSYIGYIWVSYIKHGGGYNHVNTHKLVTSGLAPSNNFDGRMISGLSSSYVRDHFPVVFRIYCPFSDLFLKKNAPSCCFSVRINCLCPITHASCMSKSNSPPRNDSGMYLNMPPNSSYRATTEPQQGHMGMFRLPFDVSIHINWSSNYLYHGLQPRVSTTPLRLLPQ